MAAMNQVLQRLDKPDQLMQQLLHSMKNMEERMKNMEERMENMDERMKNVDERMEKMDERMEKMDQSVNKKLDVLLNAVPAAAEIPKVYVCGDFQSAQRDGPSSTWTLVKAKSANVGNSDVGNSDFIPTKGAEEHDRYTYFLVSTAHCVHEIANAEEDGGERSVIYLCKNLETILRLENDDTGKASVCKVGFHKKIIDKNYFTDIVFLQLQEGFDQSFLNGYEVPEIAPSPGDDLENINSTVGSALSSPVNGSGVQYVKGQSMISFIPNFMECGCSGTLMFGIASSSNKSDTKPLGVFKGKRPTRNIDRGWIVPFPAWENVEWTNVSKQLRSFGKEIQLSANGAKLELNDSRKKMHQSRHYYLTLERREAVLITSNSKNSFGEVDVTTNESESGVY